MFENIKLKSKAIKRNKKKDYISFTELMEKLGITLEYLEGVEVNFE